LSTHIATTSDGMPSRIPSRLVNFRIIPRIETHPVITKLAKTAVGKAVILFKYTERTYPITEQFRFLAHLFTLTT